MNKNKMNTILEILFYEWRLRGYLTEDAIIILKYIILFTIAIILISIY